MMTQVWPMMKTWRKLGLGPVELVFSLRRRVRMTPGTTVPARPNGYAGATPALDAPRAEIRADVVAADAPRLARGTAVIVGAGPGLGHALARRLALDGFDLVLVTRDAARNLALAQELAERGGKVTTMCADATDEKSVLEVFAAVKTLCDSPALVVYALQEFGPGTTLEVTAPAFESAWRHNCLGAFLVGRSAAGQMAAAGHGTLVFVGSTSSIIGRAGHLNLAVGKFGQRAIAQVLARELWPSGVHVAHLMIDADIQESDGDAPAHPQSCPKQIAESVLAIHNQPRTAWSSELDLRPWNEAFWQHC